MSRSTLDALLHMIRHQGPGIVLHHLDRVSDLDAREHAELCDRLRGLGWPDYRIASLTSRHVTNGGCNSITRESEAGMGEKKRPMREITSIIDRAPPAITASSGAALIVRQASQIMPEPVTWLWPGRLAVGKQT